MATSPVYNAGNPRASHAHPAVRGRGLPGRLRVVWPRGRRPRAGSRRLRGHRQAVLREELHRLPQQPAAEGRHEPRAASPRADLVGTHLEDIEHVLLKLRTGEMPPEDEERPDQKDVEAVTAWIEREFSRLERMTPPDPGRVTARRLNRTEYNNTVRDLFGVDVRPADDFPQDDAGYGFDNIADVLSLSPVLLEKYMVAAERVVRTAMFGHEAQAPALVRLKAPTAVVAPLRTPPASYDATGLSLPNSAHASHRVTVPGQYLIRAFMNGKRPNGSMPVRVGLYVDGALVAEQVLDPAAQASFDDDEQELDGKTLEFTVPLAAGERWIAATIIDLFDGLPERYNGPNPSTRPEQHQVKEFKPPPRVVSEERLAELRKQFDERQAALKKAPINTARVGRLELAGPFEPDTKPSRESLAAVYACGHVGRAGSPSRPHLAPRKRRVRERPTNTNLVRAQEHLRRRAARVPPPRGTRGTRAVRRGDGEGAEGGRVVRRSAGHRAAGAAGVAGLPVPHRAGPCGRRPGSRSFRSATTSWRRGCRTSSGPACPTPSCVASPTARRCDRRACSTRRSGACSPTRKRRRWSRSSAASGCSSAPSSRWRPTATSSPPSTTTSGSPCATRRCCSSSTSCARTGACWSSSTRSTRSSTSGWRGTTASPA